MPKKANPSNQAGKRAHSSFVSAPVQKSDVGVFENGCFVLPSPTPSPQSGAKKQSKKSGRRSSPKRAVTHPPAHHHHQSQSPPASYHQPLLPLPTAPILFRAPMPHSQPMHVPQYNSPSDLSNGHFAAGAFAKSPSPTELPIPSFADWPVVVFG
eukprot:CAMPEP_0177650434 /NCGR_PEP_ID=MMETSP0447-20121125/11941_1 /TAXON_ID=0 /ORGANISM="Stygamoeba regulata, Strain BSH-02190019" /LENGTH=153 /DNA_ID=CAMNT_0019153305 /DNA_START=91 /DNA_END=552 /DNA_ORIENTATION=+